MTTDGITIIEGLEAVRLRPVMYIGPEEPGRSLRSRLLEVVVGNVAEDTLKLREIRVALWRDGAMTVAYDGDPTRSRSAPCSTPYRSAWSFRRCTVEIAIAPSFRAEWSSPSSRDPHARRRFSRSIDGHR